LARLALRRYRVEVTSYQLLLDRCGVDQDPEGADASVGHAEGRVQAGFDSAHNVLHDQINGLAVGAG
jgi:hypothetical protein